MPRLGQSFKREHCCCCKLDQFESNTSSPPSLSLSLHSHHIACPGKASCNSHDAHAEQGVGQRRNAGEHSGGPRSRANSYFLPSPSSRCSCSCCSSCRGCSSPSCSSRRGVPRYGHSFSVGRPRTAKAVPVVSKGCKLLLLLLVRLLQLVPLVLVLPLLHCCYWCILRYCCCGRPITAAAAAVPAAVEPLRSPYLRTYSLALWATWQRETKRRNQITTVACCISFRLQLTITSYILPYTPTREPGAERNRDFRSPPAEPQLLSECPKVQASFLCQRRAPSSM